MTYFKNRKKQNFLKKSSKTGTILYFKSYADSVVVVLKIDAFYSVFHAEP
jgi:hypothetical protein